MGRAGFSTNGSLAFLLVLNGGAVVGALVASRFADRFGPKPVVAASFLLGALAVALLTVELAARRAAGVRRRRRAGHQRHPDPDLRVRRHLLPHERPQRGRGLVRGLRPPGRDRRPADRRAPRRLRSRARVDLLRACGARRAGRGARGGRAAGAPRSERRCRGLPPRWRGTRPCLADLDRGIRAQAAPGCVVGPTGHQGPWRCGPGVRGSGCGGRRPM